MKQIEQTFNEDRIKEILRMEGTYEHLAYDGSPDIDKYDLDLMNNVWFILRENKKIAGMIKLGYLNNITWVPHIFIFEQYRGKGSVKWGGLVARYMRSRYGARKFLVFTPYEAAKKYAEKMGFKHLAVLSKSIKKNGKLLDQYMMEME